MRHFARVGDGACGIDSADFEANSSTGTVFLKKKKKKIPTCVRRDTQNHGGRKTFFLPPCAVTWRCAVKTFAILEGMDYVAFLCVVTEQGIVMCTSMDEPSLLQKIKVSAPGVDVVVRAN